MKDRQLRTILMVCVQLTAILLLVQLASPSDAKPKQVRKRAAREQSLYYGPCNLTQMSKGVK